MNDERRHNREHEARGELPVDALLSAYVDDRESLTAGELERVEQLLANDAGARQVHAELQVVIGELRQLEAVAAPRTYHLDARMVGAPEPVQMTATTAWYARHAGAIRWATAAAAILFVFVLSADLVLHGIVADPSADGDSVNSRPSNQTELSGDEAADDSMPAAEGGDAEGDDAEADEAAGDADDAADGELAPDEPESDDATDATTLAAPTEAEAAAEAEEEAAEDESSGADADNDAAGEDREDDAEAEESDGSADATPEAIPTAQIGIAEENAGDDDVADDTARSTGATATAGDQASAPEMYAFDEDAAATEDGDSRRIWRIAEFSLVVILALLITAMIVLPRMARAPTRRP